MLLGSLMFGLLLAAAAFVLATALRQTRRRAFRIAFFVFLVGGLTGLALYAARHVPPASERPLATRGDGYVASDSCRECHPDHYRSWHASYHRTMTQVAGPQSVLAPFAGEIEVAGSRYDLQRDDDAGYWVEMPNPEPTAHGRPARVRRQVLMTTGSHHMQVFWYGAGGRRLANLPIVYLLDEQQWVPRNSAFIMPTRCAQQRADAGPNKGQWNLSCIECHATQGRPRFRDNETMDTRVAEFGIACEACHGPGEQHILANRNPLRRYRLRGKSQPDPTIVNPARLATDRSAHTCGQCHSIQHVNSRARYLRWNEDGHEFRPGDDLAIGRVVLSAAARHHPTMKEIEQKDPRFFQNSFWKDGMVRVAGREFNGLLETACFQRGEMTCLSCHRMHLPDTASVTPKQWANDQLEPGLPGNQACLQCHPSYADRLAEHTHHAAASTGSQCYNCHMPHTTYGLLKAIRSHQIDSPHLPTTLATGRPNACNLCHLDKSLAWTSARLSDWYGHPQPRLEADQAELPASVIWLLSGDAGQRALAAWSMSWQPAVAASGSEWTAPYLAQLLDDPYDAVRFVAWRSLRTLPNFESFSYDFVAPAEQRAEARRRAMQSWQSGGQSGRRLPSLFHDDGSVRSDVIQRLNEARDDTDISLVE